LKNVILKPLEGIKYTVVQQYKDNSLKAYPEFLKRDDITLAHMPGKGVTKSRSLAIELAEGGIRLFSDDDVIYNQDYFEKIINAFEENEELDIGLFKIKTSEGEPEYKKYPVNRTVIKKRSLCRHD